MAEVFEAELVKVKVGGNEVADTKFNSDINKLSGVSANKKFKKAPYIELKKSRYQKIRW